MNLEELLSQEREKSPPNPLLHRTDEIIGRVRRRRRARVARAGVVGLVACAVLASASWQLVPAGSELSTAAPRAKDATRLSQVTADVPLDAGRYVISIADATAAPRLPVLTVPDGYEAIEEGVGVRTDDADRYVWAWNITRVFSHPCKDFAVAEPVGPSVADLAEALEAQPLGVGTVPVPVTIGGYRGLYLELSVPAHVDLAACPADKFNLWPTRWQEFAGQVDMLWILDVEGERVTFAASHDPSLSEDKVAELKRMVTTATFVPGTGS